MLIMVKVRAHMVHAQLQIPAARRLYGGGVKVYTIEDQLCAAFIRDARSNPTANQHLQDDIYCIATLDSNYLSLIILFLFLNLNYTIIIILLLLVLFCCLSPAPPVGVFNIITNYKLQIKGQCLLYFTTSVT